MAARRDYGGDVSQMQQQQQAPDDILRILVASDTHLGYGERDPIRADDSFATFSEIFEIALREQADMVLLAGDLFHDNKPSRRAMHRCMEIMRDHCLGDRGVNIEVLSDQQSNFHSKYVDRLLMRHNPILATTHDVDARFPLVQVSFREL